MKRIVVVLGVLCLALNAGAQTWDEWFHQKRTQIRYLLEQVSALRVYGNAVRKGYDLVDSGLKSIGRLKESDLRLHQDHFASLLTVEQRVKGSEFTRRIVFLQTAIQKLQSECKRKQLMASEFSSAEKDYFAKVLRKISEENITARAEAVLLTSDGFYLMTDDERLKRLQALSVNIEDLYVFARHFSNTISIAALSRTKEQKEVKKLKALY